MKRRKRAEPETPVFRFVKLAWCWSGGQPHSWERYNAQVRDTVHMTVAGFQWAEGDMDAVMSLANDRYGIKRCLGENGIEKMYRRAVQHNNASAYHEIERYLGREPIIADNVDGRKKGRLYVGGVFTWEGMLVEVTSFNGDGKAVCCRYANSAGRRAPDRRFRVSAEDVKRARREKKKASLPIPT